MARSMQHAAAEVQRSTQAAYTACLGGTGSVHAMPAQQSMPMLHTCKRKKERGKRGLKKVGREGCSVRWEKER